MQLYLCEKPSQGSDLADVLGVNNKADGYRTNSDSSIIVTWCIGHLLELFSPEEYDSSYKTWSFSNLPIIPSTFLYNPKKETSKQLKIVIKLIKKASEVIIATDFDREGEAIARTVLQRAEYSGLIRRLCLTALDTKSIRKALNDIRPGDQTINMYKAATARAEADWLIGMNLSRLYTLSLNIRKEVFAVGRVMTPTVMLILERDKEIKNFKPEPFFELFAEIIGGNTQYRVKYQIPADKLDCNNHLKNKAVLSNIVQKLNATNAKPIVQAFTTEQVKESAPLPFDLSSLQQFCNKQWGYSAEQTLNIAQSLYETHKATSYPRTDCRYLPESQITDIPTVLKALKLQDPNLSMDGLLPNFAKCKCFNTAKISAHHAIIPTENSNLDLAKFSSEELNVFLAIRRSYIAQLMPAAIYDKESIVLDAHGEIFKASTKNLRIAGWKILYGVVEETEENIDQYSTQKLPKSTVGSVHTFKSFDIEDKLTTAPKHFTEASLLKAMENISRFVKEEKYKKILRESSGLGTPATRASIISSAIKRKYIRKSSRQLLATDKAQLLADILPSDIKSAGMTAAWEQVLEKIAEGTTPKAAFIQGITRWVNYLCKLQIKEN